MKSLKQSVLRTFSRLRGKSSAKQEPFKALDDVDFNVEEGEVLGIIGTNGAGKSMLLKLLARVSAPTKGGIKVRGSVLPLLLKFSTSHFESRDKRKLENELN